MKLKRGDILLVHSSGLIPWLIRKITQSHWNHVAWAIDSDLIVEAQGGQGVTVKDPSGVYDLTNTELIKIVRIKEGLIPEEKLTTALLRAQLANGRKYDWWLIAQLGWLYLTGKRKYQIADDWDTAWICSELIAEPLWEASFFKFREDIPVSNIVPDDIATSPYVDEVIS
jgi:hypothetical protein